MNSFTTFLGDSRVHDTVLVSMIITSFFAAIRRFKQVDDTPIITSFTAAWKLFWNFAYDWAVGFWSLRNGQGNQKNELHSQTLEQTPTRLLTQEVTSSSNQDPILPVEPASTK